MQIHGTIHCLFEQSGTFKKEFQKLGYNTFDYDIENQYNQTDFVVDLFSQIEAAWRNKPSLLVTPVRETPPGAFAIPLACHSGCPLLRRGMQPELAGSFIGYGALRGLHYRPQPTSPKPIRPNPSWRRCIDSEVSATSPLVEGVTTPSNSPAYRRSSANTREVMARSCPLNPPLHDGTFPCGQHDQHLNTLLPYAYADTHARRRATCHPLPIPLRILRGNGNFFSDKLRKNRMSCCPTSHVGVCA